MKWALYIVMVVVTFLYLVLGAFVFNALEHGNELQAKFTFAKVHRNFLNNNTCITADILSQYVFEVVETQGKGVSVFRIIDQIDASNSSMSDEDIESLGTKWDIPSSVLFCVTVISTIGYGNMAPKTKHGQLFCIFYALIGIPMFAAVLVGTGERMQIPIKVLHRRKPWIKRSSSKDEQIKSFVFLSTGTFIVVFIPSIVFTLTQKWSFLEAVYYTVITLTTIGFGDLVPAEGKMKKRHVLIRVFLGLWILFGLSWGALILSEIGSLLQKKISTATSQTKNKLSTLEDIVKKKAKEAKTRISNKEKEFYPTKNGKELPEAVVCTVDSIDSDEEELKYEPIDSD